jgi:DNA (cytosine-5)-methyltransferase 1
MVNVRVITFTIEGQVWNVVEMDLSDFSLSEYSGKIDLLGGGPPCQPFSQAGNHEGRKDARDMFSAFIRAVREVALGAKFKPRELCT